ncbi:MAG: TVP38/TMEM64 family protein [Gammaproteobacteria bacterium]
MNVTPPATQHRRKAIVFAGAAVVLAAIAWYVNRYVSLSELAMHEDRIRVAIAMRPLRSFMLGLAVYITLSLIPGIGGKAIVFGWLFGFWRAVIIVIVSLTCSAMVIFSLSRYLFRDRIERRYTGMLSLMNRHIEKEGAFYLLTLRMAHAPYSIVNPVSGASRVPMWTFVWTTAIGLLPGTAVWAYVGVRLPSLRDLANSGPGSLLDPLLITALVASAMLPLFFRGLVRRFGIPAGKRRGNAALPARMRNHDGNDNA